MSTVDLRPNGTVTAADSVTGAASAHAAASDDSDSSYFVDGDNVVLDLETHTLSTAVTKSLQLTIRGRADSGLVPTNANCRLRSGGLENTWVQLTFVELPDTIVERSASAAVSLTQTQLDALVFSAYMFGSADLRVYEVTATLTYVAQPSTTVTAVSPDPYTASTLVPIAWTNTLDADGGDQTRYEIKVFTDAQYGAGGFDPDTSTPYYTSGEVVSASAGADVGPLENGDTYRAYVRVAQTVNGALHWSDWAYDQFTMDVDTADVDTVTAVATDASGLITITVEWDNASEGWAYIEVQRSIDGGATWVDVRGATYVATVDSGATDFTVTDYEVPNGVDANYRARATYLSSGQPITGSWVESSAESWNSTDCWLKAPNDPTLNTTFKLGGRDEYRRRRRSGVFEVLSADAPVVVSDVRSTRSGVLRVVTESAAEAAALSDLLDGAAVLLVQFPSSMDIADAYLAVLDDTEVFRMESADLVNRMWALSYVEVTAPADPDAGR